MIWLLNDSPSAQQLSTAAPTNESKVAEGVGFFDSSSPKCGCCYRENHSWKSQVQ